MTIPRRAAHVAILLLFAAISCQPNTSVSLEPARFEYSKLQMGVRVRLVVYANDENTAVNACRAAFDRVAQIDKVASDYLIDSELNALCRKAGVGPIKVSDDLWTLLVEAQRVAEMTGGRFDVTAGPVVRLWRQARQFGQLPPKAEVEAALSKVGWRKLKLDPQGRTAELTVPGMKLDLGGIAKGYAGDQAIAVLKQQGIRSALFEAGGDMVASDAPPGTDGWKIRLADAGPDMPSMVVLRNGACSTSGDTEQFVEIGGKHYSHVVDPLTGMGLTSRAMATVKAALGIHTDVLSTACTLVDKDAATELVKKYPCATVWIRTVK